MNTEASPSPAAGKSPTLDEFETLYARLQEFKEEGEGDSFQADALRLRLDSLYDVMSDDERQVVRELAARDRREDDDFDGGYDQPSPPPAPATPPKARQPKAPSTPKLKAAKLPKSKPAVVAEPVDAAVPATDTATPAPDVGLPKKTRTPKPKSPRTRKKAGAEPMAPPADAGAEGVQLTENKAVTPDPVAPAEPQIVESVSLAEQAPVAIDPATPPAEPQSEAEAQPATHAPLPKPAEIFDRSVTFESIGLRSSLLKAISAMGFEHPTDIQARLIPPALAGKDVIGQARTGTGKTAAFGLPILQMADKDTPMQALILVPTRELAAQVAAEMDEIGRFTPIRTSCIIGGESMRDQARSISKGGHVMVGTPGRVMDMHQRGEIHFHNIKFIVLDEVDRMLDIGFREDIRKILKSVHTEHQTIFVSATISDEIERLGRSFMKPDAEKIVTISGSLTVSLVDQKYVSVEPWDKRAMLLFILRREKPETTVVFCRTKATVDKLAKYLADHGIEARPIHGDMPQNKRTKVMDSMRSGKLRVLIASDLAARGLDIDHITHVVNYDLPEDPEVYVHRIGRTARAGRRGFAWSFVTREEGQRLTEIEMLCSTMIEKMEYKDWVPGPVPDDIRVSKPRVTHRPESAVDLLAAKAVERAAPSPIEGLTAEQVKAMFPDGVIPKSLPKSTLGSKFKRRR